MCPHNNRTFKDEFFARVGHIGMLKAIFCSHLYHIPTHLPDLTEDLVLIVLIAYFVI